MNIPKTSAHFATSLANKISASATSMTVASGTDKAGNALSGLYGWVVDRGSASEEFMLGTISGTTITITARGLDPGDGKTEVTALKLAHRRGATVEITDYPLLAILARILNADETVPNKLQYASSPTFTNALDLITKAYADALALAGAPDASATTKGVSKLSVAPVSPTDPIALGENDGRVPTQGENDALAGTNGTPSSTNKFITQSDNRTKYLYATRQGDAASGTQNIAHGLGVVPKTVRIKCSKVIGANVSVVTSDASYNGTDSVSINETILASTATAVPGGTLAGTYAIQLYDDVSGTNTQLGVITFDATNIIITWTKGGTPGNNTIYLAIFVTY